jgi:hypothetical protein
MYLVTAKYTYNTSRIKDIERKKNHAEECLREIRIVALAQSQQTEKSNTRKRALATPSPMASGSRVPLKDLPERRRVPVESEIPGTLGSTPERPCY